MPAFDAFTTLAQTVPGRDPTRMLIFIGVMIMAVVVFGLVVVQLRKRLFAKADSANSSALLMDDLRAMRSRGAITEDEYQRTRRRLVESLAASSAPQLSDPSQAAIGPSLHLGLSKPDAQGGKGLAGRTPAPGSSSPHRAGPTPRVDLTGDPLPEPQQDNNRQKPKTE